MADVYAKTDNWMNMAKRAKNADLKDECRKRNKL